MNTDRSAFPVRPGLAMGALGAALLGGLFAFEFDRVAAMAGQLMLPAGQSALLQALGLTALTGSLGWAAAIVMTRTITRRAVRPYLILTEQLEGHAEGSPLDLLRDPSHSATVHRLARALLAAQDAAAVGRTATSELNGRYDALCEANARERNTLMAILMEKATGRVAPTPIVLPRLVAPAIASAMPLRPPMPVAPETRPALLIPQVLSEDLLGPLRRGSAHAPVTAH